MPETTDELSVTLAEFLDSHRFGKYRGVVREIGSGDKDDLFDASNTNISGEDNDTTGDR